MKQRVLVADDSLTIQKVIKITLSNEPFDLEECHEDKTLFEQVKNSSPQIILLDFNLSESKTGYDLAREIKQIIPDSKILMLYGTFDTIDEDLLSSSGCDYHITKPFDGNKFIHLCRSMLSDSELEKDDSTEKFEIPEQIVSSSIPDPIDDGLDDWVVNQPEPVEEKNEDLFPEVIPEQKNILEESIGDWSMEVPGPIDAPNSEDLIGEIPSIIPSTQTPPINKDSSFPEGDDLSYPDQIEVDEPVSNLTPIEELASPSGLEIEANTDQPAGIHGTETQEQLDNLKEKIQDEIDEDDLWEIDEYEDDYPEPTFEPLDRSEIEQIDDDNILAINQVETPADFPADVMSEEFVTTEQESLEDNDIDSNLLTKELEQRLVDQLFEKFKPLVMERLEDFCKENVEKVSWDVIPDLAENIIQKELSNITKKVMGEDEE